MAAPYQNYDTGTFLTDLVVRPEFLSYIQEEIYERCKWIQSGVLVRNSALDCKKGGVRVQVPFFQPIDPVEEQIKSTADWGTSSSGYLTPQKIEADSQIMTIMHRGFAYAADDLSKLGTGADPLAAVRSYMARAILKLRTRTLLSQLEGLTATALADNVYDVSQNTSGATEANFLTASSVVGGRNKLGERGEDLTTIAMHSDVYAYLMQVGALTFSTSSLATGGEIVWGGGGVGLNSVEVAYFMGLRVIQDDMLAPTVNAGGADQYPVYLMGPGSVAEGVQQELRTEADRNILSMQDVLQWNYHHGFHVFGTSWAGAGDNPTNTELETDSNWSMVYQTSKLVPVVKLLVNTPFAGNV